MDDLGITDLLERWGLKGPCLFFVALGISAIILIASYLLATRHLNPRKRKP